MGSFDSEVVYNLEKIAIKTLNDDYGALIAKRAAGIVAKKILSDKIKKENKNLGHLALAVMRATDQADLRQWSTLPRTLQIVKLRLPKGRYTLNIDGLGEDDVITERGVQGEEIQIRPGQKVFLNWRSVL